MRPALLTTTGSSTFCYKQVSQESKIMEGATAESLASSATDCPPWHLSSCTQTPAVHDQHSAPLPCYTPPAHQHILLTGSSTTDSQVACQPPRFLARMSRPLHSSVPHALCLVLALLCRDHPCGHSVPLGPPPGLAGQVRGLARPPGHVSWCSSDEHTGSAQPTSGRAHVRCKLEGDAAYSESVTAFLCHPTEAPVTPMQSHPFVIAALGHC